jgi:hypothetical protein
MSNGNRKQLGKKQRMQIYERCHGKCAYCGCDLKYEAMQIDHVVPLIRGGDDTADNMLPACRSCNHRKGGSTLDGFRKQIGHFLRVLERDSVTYRNAVRFGLIIPNPHPIKFYFEKVDDPHAIETRLVCDFVMLGRLVSTMHDCNTCGRDDCAKRPRAGEHVAFNCPYYEKEMEK